VCDAPVVQAGAALNDSGRHRQFVPEWSPQDPPPPHQLAERAFDRNARSRLSA
jgi:hypothetical protein